MNNNFTIFVSSSDGYEDCWNPFFTLLNKFWPNLDIPIVLNTNTKSFSFPGLNINCPIVSKKSNKNFKWGERLRNSLELVDTEIILFFLDDYFIKSPVMTDKVEELFQLMEREKISHIMLYPEPGPNIECNYPMLVKRGQHVPYRFSFQVGFWRKKKLIKYLRDHEDPWHAERWGTKRAWQISDLFYCIDKKYYENNNPIIDYMITGGIIRGKWSKDVKTLIKDNNLDIDFSKRDFYNYTDDTWNFKRIKEKITKLPIGFRSQFDLLLLKGKMKVGDDNS